MITVLPCKTPLETEEIFRTAGIEMCDNAGAVVARSGEEIIGYCAFSLDERSITLLGISPAGDLLLADGIIRSALHVAAERSAMDAHYSDSFPEEVLYKLGFIKDAQSRTVDIDKLFGGCNCKKDN